VDQDSWYIGLTLSHRPREAVDYSLSAGHELRLGAQSDMTEVTYFRPSVTWRILRDLTLRTSVFYEHGQQSLGGPSQALAQEEFDWYGGSLSLGYPLMKRLQASLNYRLTFRSSNLESPNRDYTQNVLGLLLTYRLP
jgi:outer membrane protein assembly factor BamA